MNECNVDEERNSMILWTIWSFSVALALEVLRERHDWIELSYTPSLLGAFKNELP